MSETAYDDIIHLSRPVSKRHPKMSLQDRAAQFSPFAALSGFEDGLKETARKTVEKKELAESEKNLINEQLNCLVQALPPLGKALPTVTVEYFVADAQKNGGSYRTKSGTVKRVDIYRNLLIFTDNTQINIEDIIHLSLTR
ncbi:hypothetical protein [Candidatus Avelusimicrobium sp.]|uniref:hypothetical protein n=1 Tax=Candidatus Avelusimicrobium sp. TaxID=3048833 RepID=UPI003D7F0AE1